MKKAVIKSVLGLFLCCLCLAGKKEEVRAETIWLSEDDFFNDAGAGFCKEHQNQIGVYSGDIRGYEVVFPVSLYDYPGSTNSVESLKEGEFDKETLPENWMTPKYFYEDEEGKLWGYLNSYNWGYRRGWYCISTLPVSVVKDYNQSGNLDLGDAQLLLRAALKMDTMKKENGEAFSLEDAQTMLKAALKISDDKTMILKPGTGQELPEQPENPVVTGPSVDIEPENPIVTGPAADVDTEQPENPDEDKEVTKPAVEIPPLVTGPAVAPATGEATQLAEIYIKVFEQYRSYGIGAYIAIYELECLNEMDRYVVESYLEDKYGKDVMWVDSYKTLIANGLGYDHGDYWWGIYGVIYYGEEISISEDMTRVVVSGSAGRGGLAAQGYTTILEKQDGQWVVIEHIQTWIS